MDDKLTKQPTNPLTTKRSIGLPKLHARMQQAAKAIDAVDPTTVPNRIGLMLDVSTSMHGNKIEHLRDALMSFLNNCNFADTSCAIETFPFHDHRVALTCLHPVLLTTVMGLEASGSTPMHEAMEFILKQYSVTRCVIVSDGEADSRELAIEYAQNYREAEVPVDCVHIGTSTGGEATLQQIAEITGGKFIKFTDIASFGRNFKYLTPAMYGQLTSGNVSAAQLGAKEVK